MNFSKQNSENRFNRFESMIYSQYDRVRNRFESPLLDDDDENSCTISNSINYMKETFNNSDIDSYIDIENLKIHTRRLGHKRIMP